MADEYWSVVYRAVADWSDLRDEVAKAKAALSDLSRSAKAEGDAETSASLAAAAAHRTDTMAIDAERRALEQLAVAAKAASVWTEFGGRNDMAQHLSDLGQETNWLTMINRAKWMGFSNPQAAYSWRQMELQQAYLMNRAKYGGTSSGTGYTTPDQYLGYLQREYAAERDLNAVMLSRAAVYRSNADAYLAYANALKGHAGTLGTLSEGNLATAQAYEAALTGLPSEVTTRLNVDDSGFLAKLAADRAMLTNFARTYTARDVITASYELGGMPVGQGQAAERIPVSFTGPWQDQAAKVLATIAMINKQRAEVPVDFNIDPSEVAALKVKLGQLNIQDVVTEHLVSAGGAAGGGGGGPPPAAAAASAGEPDPQVPKAWQDLAAAELAAGMDADIAKVKLASLAAATAGDAETAAKLAYAYQTLSAESRAATAAARDAAAAEKDAADQAQRNVAAFMAMGVAAQFAWGTFGLWHLAIDIIIELLASIIPAIGTLIAGLTAFGVAGYAAAQTVYQRLQAVRTAVSATGQAIFPLTGQLQAMQDAARPQVWQLYGDALTIISNKTGIFARLAAETGNVLDHLAARVTVWAGSASKGLNTFFTVGGADLAQFGRFFANLGIALMNLIRVTQQTHIDQIFLSLLVALSQLLVLITKLPAPLLATAVALHAVWLYGGLLLSIVVQLLGPLRNLALSVAGISAVDSALGSLPKNASGMDRLRAALADIGSGFVALPGKIGFAAKSTEAAGTAAKDTALAMDEEAAAMSGAALAGDKAAVSAGRFAGALGLLAKGGIAALVLALAYVSDKVVTARDSTQQWIDTMNRGLGSSSLFTVIGKTASDLAAVTERLANSQGLNAQAAHELTGAQAQLSGQLQQELVHVGDIATAYGVSMPMALALLNTAGVKTSDLFTNQAKVWAADAQQVSGLVQGYAAMGQGLTQLQGDVSVQLVMNSDQLKSMQTLNQAWDNWLTMVQAGPTALVGYLQSVNTLSTNLQAAGASLGGLNAQSLTARGTFDQMIPQMGKVQDAIRQYGAVLQNGADGSALLVRGTKDTIAASGLLASTNQQVRNSLIAVAEQADPSISTWQKLTQWVGNQGAAQAAADLDKVMTLLQTPVSNLAQDAAKLTTALQQDLNPAMAQATFNALGGQAAFSTFATDLQKFGPNSQTTITAGKTVSEMLLSIDKNSKDAQDQFVAWGESMGLTQGQATKLWGEVSKGQTPLESMRQGLAKSATASDNLAKSGFFAQARDSYAESLRTVAKWFSTDIPNAIGIAAGSVSNFFTRQIPQAAGSVSSFFTGTVGPAILGAWAHVWSALVSPVTHAFDSVKSAITSNFDNWWKSHGSAVTQVWDSVTHYLSQAWRNFTGGLQQDWHTFTSWFSGGAGDISKPISQAWGALANSLKPVLDSIKQAFTIVWTGIEAGAKNMWDLIAAVGKSVWDALVAVFKTAWDALVASMKMSWDLLVGVLKAAWDIFVGIINVALDLLTGHWRQAWTDMKAAFDQVVKAIATAFTQAWNALFTYLKQGWNNFATMFQQLWNNAISLLKQLWNNFWNWFSGTIIAGFRTLFMSTIPGWFDSFLNKAKSTWNSVWNFFNSTIISPMDRFFTSTIPGWWNSFVRGASGAMGQISSSIESGFKNAVNWVINNIIDGAINIINDVTGVFGIPKIGRVNPLAAGGETAPMRYATGSVPGNSAVDGTHIIAMGGEYMVRQSARMALENSYGRGFMDMLNQADSWLGAGSRGTPASQARNQGVNTGPARVLPFPAFDGYASGGQIAAEAEKFIGAPYVYGGTSPSGWDCSGFVQYVLEQLGWHNVPRTSEAQWGWSAHESSPSIGGLVFAQFPGDNAAPGHVGFYVGNGNVLSARDPQLGTGVDSLSSWSGHIVGYGNEPNATGLIGQIINSVTGAVENSVGAVEGLINSAGSGLSSALGDIGHYVGEGGSALLNLANEGARALFDAAWNHTINPLVNQVPAGNWEGSAVRLMPDAIKKGVDSFLGGKDSGAQTTLNTANLVASTIAAAGPGGGSAAQNQALARSMMPSWSSGLEWTDWVALWMQESGWNQFAQNPSSGAYGIPQALPFTKMPMAAWPAPAGTSNPRAQIGWGIQYIQGRYGDPIGAWGHEQAYNWYPYGGIIGEYAAGGTAADNPLPPNYPAEWQKYGPALIGAGWAEEGQFWKLMGDTLPKSATKQQAAAFASWKKAMQSQQLKTIGLGRNPPGAFSVLYEGLNGGNPAGITQTQWNNFLGNMNNLVRYQEGTGYPGGANPPGSVPNSGWPAWHYDHGDWQTLLTDMKNLQSIAQSAEQGWHGTYGAGAPASTPGVATQGVVMPNGLSINLSGVATMGGPGNPVFNANPAADMGFSIIPVPQAVGKAAGGNIDVLDMFANGITLMPTAGPGGIPVQLLATLAASGNAQQEPSRRLSEAAAAVRGPALNVQTMTINNPQPEKPSDSIARASNRLAFLAGRGMS